MSPRRLLIRVALVLALYVATEGLAFFSFWVIAGEPLSMARVETERLSLVRSGNLIPANPAGVADPGPDWMKYDVIHPYLGFVEDPRANDDTDIVNYHRSPVNEYGFWDDKLSLQKKSDGRVIIGVLGGSVAYWFSVYGAKTLVAELQEAPQFAHKEIILVRLALGGYKEPQQLLALTYLLSLGAEFDIAVNIDGFNEIALPFAENIPKHIFPFYPREWSLRTDALPDAALTSLIGRIAYLRSERRSRAMAASKPLFRYSVTANLLWKYMDIRLAADLSQAQLDLLAYRRDAGAYAASGPRRQYDGEAALFSDLAAVWERSSLQLHRLCTANGIAYMHFLQPNQYLPDSKPMGPEERKQAFLQDHPYRKPVVAGYPYLIASGVDLVRQGVAFHDLTGMFATNAESVYADTCCHLNQHGYDLLAIRIANALTSDLAPQARSDLAPGSPGLGVGAN